MPSSMNTQCGNLLDYTAHSGCIRCFLMLQQLGKRSTIEPSAGEGDQPHPNDTLGWSPPPWNSLGLIWLGRRLGECIMKCTNWSGCPVWTHAMWRWQRISTRRSSTQSRSTSIIGRNLFTCHQQLFTFSYFCAKLSFLAFLLKCVNRVVLSIYQKCSIRVS